MTVPTAAWGPERLVEALADDARDQRVAAVQLGLGYSAVRLGGGEVGLAWTPKGGARCCQQFAAAGTLAGRPAADLLARLATGADPLDRLLGLATANALIARRPPAPALPGGDLALLDLRPTDHLVMVGHFAPLLPAIRATGARLDIVENEPDAGELGPEAGRAALGRCTVAIVTATSLITGGLADYLQALGPARAVMLLGPSTPLLPEAFTGSRVTLLAGSRVHDRERALQVVAEGGGTPALRPSLTQVCLAVPAPAA